MLSPKASSVCCSCRRIDAQGAFSTSLTHNQRRLSRPSRLKSIVKAKRRDDDDDDEMKPQKMLTNAVDAVVDYVPSSVPRGVAKGGVFVVGGLVIFGLIQKVLSGLITVALLGGLGYLYLTRSGGDDDEDDGDKRRNKSSDSADDGSPLSDARRIMDKYK